ncbi:MAG: hypothetical protein ACOX08_11975 [Methanobacterium sp.]
MTATLTDTHNNKPLQGKTINYTIQGDPNTYQTTTNSNGIATLTYKIIQNTGTYTITATFTGDTTYTGTTSNQELLTPTKKQNRHTRRHHRI